MPDYLINRHTENKEIQLTHSEVGGGGWGGGREEADSERSGTSEENWIILFHDV